VWIGYIKFEDKGFAQGTNCERLGVQDKETRALRCSEITKAEQLLTLNAQLAVKSNGSC